MFRVYLIMKLSFIATFILAGAAQASSKKFEKKFIEFGWDVPNTSFLRMHIREMERRPFDGVVLRLMGQDGSLQIEGWPAFTKTPWKSEWFENCLSDLKATKFGKFQDNFILVWSTPADAEWFNDNDWAAFAGNMRILARIAKQGGLKGICFDPEPYGKHNPWNYAQQSLRQKKSFAEYQTRVRERGRQIMRAIAGEFPDITILMLFGVTVTRSAIEASDPQSALESHSYGLYPSFLEGWLDAIPDQARLVDGHENAYWYKTAIQFYQGYHLMHQGAFRVISPSTWDRYRQHVLAGFGLYMDANWGKPDWGWHPEDPSKNYYPPEVFKGIAATGLRISDEYVWVYSEAPNWWTGNKLPEAYADALAEAKQEATEAPFTTSVKVETLHIPKLSGSPPKIDGTLTDPLWQTAAQIPAFRRVGTWDSPKEATEAFVTYDDQYLFVAFRCMESNTGELKAKETKRDGDVWMDDCVELFLTADKSVTPYYHFILNYVNTQWDSKENDETSFNAVWQSATGLCEGGWCAEMAIPWSALGRNTPTPGTILRANLGREQQRLGEISSWSPFISSFLEPMNFGRWEF